jgi:signal transduction histidine kinase
LLPSNVLTLYAVQIATTFETLLLAMALADRLRLDVLVRRQAQQDALAAKEQVLELTQNSEARLKRAVLSRTKELEAALATETLLREQYVRFGGMVAHEFRTPLSIIQTQMSVMRKEIACGIDQMAERSQAIQSATDRLALMFDRWLDSSATLNAAFTLSPKPEILEQWLQAQLPHLTHLTSNHQLDVRLNGSRASAMVDDDHLGLVISNLIDNACKYSPAGTRVTLEVVNKPDFVGISVKDEGQGIAEEFHEKVFAEFSRLTMVEQIPGVGLGLAIVQRIVLAHGGHITLESSPGHGATFCIWLQSLTSAGQE